MPREEKIIRVFVTGAAGFLGANVIHALLERGDEVVASDLVQKTSAARLGDVLDEVEYRWMSVVDLKGEDLKGIDYVLHFAALTDVPLANSSPRYTFQLNVDAAISLFLAARDSRVPVFAMSSENAYGAVPPEHLPAVEDEPLRPRNPYAASKVAIEALGRSISFQHQLPVTFFRSSTLFGPGMRTGQVISIFCRQAVNNQPITLEGDGTQTRDFNYVDNMVEAIKTVISTPKEGFNVWNIGSGTEWSLRDLVDKILAISGSSSKVEYKPWRPGEEGRLSISIEKAKTELGYKVRVSVEEGLARFLGSMRHP